MASFPRQDIMEKDKTPAWIKQHFDYGKYLLQNFSKNRQVMTELYQSYNGIKAPASVNWLTKTYGRNNRAKYVAYRKGRNKVNLIVGEWLSQPLKATVTTTNVDAKSKKLEQLDLMTGAMAAKEELNLLKEKAGVDVMNGVQIPQGEDDPIWQKMSVKDKNEKIMQTILNEEIECLEIKRKLSRQLIDVAVVSGCFGKIEISKDGELTYDPIDLRNAIYEEIEGDDFLEKTPIKGAVISMTVNDVIRKWDLSPQQRNMLEQLKTNPDAYRNQAGWPRTYMQKNEVCVDVMHIQWKSLRAFYFKKSPKTKAQLEFDPTSTHYKVAIPTKYYEENKEKFDRQVEKGEIEVITEWAEDLWEGVRIGDEMDLFGKRVEFQTRKYDKPGNILDMQYVGFLLGTIDGIRVSLQQIIMNFDNMFDIVMYIILKELSKFKGKVLVFNRGGLPEKKTVKDIIYDAVNDAFIDVNSAADGNRAGQDFKLSDLVQEQDWGLSTSFPSLIALKQEIEQTLDALTGINESREGNIAASATASNAQQGLAASRTITLPLFFGFHEFTERLLMKIAETAKVVWAFYKTEKSEQILGTKEHNFLTKITRDMGYQDYGVRLEDSGRFMEVRQKLMQLAEASLNAKEIRFLDILKLEMAETIADSKAILTTAWDEINKIRLQESQQQAEMKARADQQLEEIISNRMKTDAELKQNNSLGQIEAKGNKQMEIDNNKQKGQLTLDQNKYDNEDLMEKNSN